MTELSPYRPLHQRAGSLYHLINDQQFFYRRIEGSPLVRELSASRPQTVGVDRDRVVSALANKALNTHNAIGILCDSGLADDAYALCRILMENFVTLAWICRADWIERIDRYGLFAAPSRRRLVRVILDHFPDSHAAKEAASLWDDSDLTAIVSKELFHDSHLKWTNLTTRNEGPLKAMMRELDPEHLAPETGNFAYAMSYFDGSHFVHSLPLSIRNIERELLPEKTYLVRVRPRFELVDMSLNLSITWTLTILTALNDFLGARIDDEIDAAVGALKELATDGDDVLRSSHVA